MLERLLSPVDDELNQHKQNQLIELAKINGASLTPSARLHACVSTTVCLQIFPQSGTCSGGLLQHGIPTFPA